MRWAVVLLLLHACFHLSYGQEVIDRSRPYALVAGGSKGIGFAISDALAKRGYNLILIARHVDALRQAQQIFKANYGVTVHILSYDLSKEESAEAIAAWCMERDVPLKMLCNVAGLGGSDDYLQLSLDSLRYMIDLNIGSCMALTYTLLPLLKQHAPAYVLNVSSMAGYAPIPDKNMYAATKSAVLFFSYALRYQLQEYDISVSCLTPGPVFTKPSIKEETKKQLGGLGMKMAVPPARVGEIAVKKTLRGKMTITPGFLASISARMIRMLPPRTVASFYARVGKKNRKPAKHAIVKK